MVVGRIGHAAGMRLTCTSLILFVVMGLACKTGGSDDSAETSADGSGTSTSTPTSTPTSGAGSSSGGDSFSSSVPDPDSGPLPDTGSAPDTGDGSSTGTGETGLADGCEALMQADCEANPACMAVLGAPEDFADCTPGPVFLGCIDAMPCDAVLTTVCRDGGTDSYQLSAGCIPPGFTACAGVGVACGGGDDCVGLDEATCAASGCTPISGAPHIMNNAGICADFANPEFLACMQGGVACPPSVPTVCPAGETQPAWDVPSGCIPDGFEFCGGEVVPAC